MKKRLVAFLLVLVMVAGFVPVTARADTPEKTGYLSDLRVLNDRTDEALLTGFDSETHEYTIILPNSENDVDVGALLSDKAPEGSTIKLYYTAMRSGYTWDATANIDSSPEDVTVVSYVLDNAATTNTLRVEVGVEGNIQTYTVTVTRPEPEKTGYLSDLRVLNDRTDEALLTGFDSETHEYTIILPNSENDVDVGALLSDKAPEGSTIKLYYTAMRSGYTWDATANIDSSPEDVTVVSYVLDDAATTNTLRVEAGVEGNIQTYTVTVNREPAPTTLTGSGTEDDPFKLNTANDYAIFAAMAADGETFSGKYLKQTADIVLPDGWQPIDNFQGNLNGGGYKLTVPAESGPLFGQMQAAGGGTINISYLKVYGIKINGAGLIDNMYFMGTGTIVLDHITLVSGSQTLKSGLVGGNGRSAHTINFINCTVEDEVIVGYDHQQSDIGSLISKLCGTVENCSSSADVYGVNNVGGLVGSRGQSMSEFQVSGSDFHGSVTGTGKNIGGIVGDGYYSTSAPNGSGVTILNCTCDGPITGGSNVGGILGAEDGVDQFWDNGPLTIRGNTFTGVVSGSSRVGGIAGYIRALNRYAYVENNDFSGCTGADKEIGFVTHIDTSAVSFGMHDGTFYFNTANYNTYTEDDWAAIYEVVDADWADTNRTKNSSIAKPNHNRTDDPLGVGGGEVVITDLIITGYKDEYMVGDEFTTDGMSITAKYSDNSTVDVDLAEVSFTGFSSTAAGVKTITASWGGFSKQFDVTVIAPTGETINVKLTVLGDTLHDMGENDPGHGLWLGGLTEWLPETGYEVDANATVWDLLNQAFDAVDDLTLFSRYTSSYDSEYIYAVQKGDVKLEEKDNYANSGWMVAVNGRHIQVGVSKMTLTDGDSVILHWCDDFYIDEAEGIRQEFLAQKPEVKAENVKSSGKIKLTWEEVPGAVSYKVFAATAADGEYALVKELDAESYIHTGKAGTKYFFKVVAVNAAGDESQESDALAKFQLPAQVTKLKAKSAKAKQVTLTWKKITGAKKYFVYMSANGKTGWKKIGTAKTNKFEYKKAAAGKKLYFKVQAVTANGKKGEFSKAISVKVKK